MRHESDLVPNKGSSLQQAAGEIRAFPRLQAGLALYLGLDSLPAEGPEISL